jgi:hypothetical protein
MVGRRTKVVSERFVQAATAACRPPNVVGVENDGDGVPESGAVVKTSTVTSDEGACGGLLTRPASRARPVSTRDGRRGPETTEPSRDEGNSLMRLPPLERALPESRAALRRICTVY